MRRALPVAHSRHRRQIALGEPPEIEVLETADVASALLEPLGALQLARFQIGAI